MVSHKKMKTTFFKSKLLYYSVLKVESSIGDNLGQGNLGNIWGYSQLTRRSFTEIKTCFGVNFLALIYML